MDMRNTDLHPLPPEHSAGQRLDTVDQVSSVTLLGIAVVGAVLTVLTNWVVFG